MKKALAETTDEETASVLLQTFTRVAHALKNRPS
jgi:truncated hemoglobin YjbI